MSTTIDRNPPARAKSPSSIVKMRSARPAGAHATIGRCPCNLAPGQVSSYAADCPYPRTLKSICFSPQSQCLSLSLPPRSTLPWPRPPRPPSPPRRCPSLPRRAPSWSGTSIPALWRGALRRAARLVCLSVPSCRCAAVRGRGPACRGRSAPASFWHPFVRRPHLPRPLPISLGARPYILA